jgi:hypothetical protein
MDEKLIYDEVEKTFDVVVVSPQVALKTHFTTVIRPTIFYASNLIEPDMAKVRIRENFLFANRPWAGNHAILTGSDYELTQMEQQSLYNKGINPIKTRVESQTIEGHLYQIKRSLVWGSLIINLDQIENYENFIVQKFLEVSLKTLMKEFFEGQKNWYRYRVLRLQWLKQLEAENRFKMDKTYVYYMLPNTCSRHMFPDIPWLTDKGTAAI